VNNQIFPIRRLLYWLLWLAGLVIIVCIGRDVYLSQQTGFLEISSPDKNAVLSISQSNQNAAYVGQGSAQLLLKPGTYVVGAKGDGRYNVAVVTVGLKERKSITINPADQYLLPSVDNIDFENFTELTDSGLSADQLENVQQAFFNFRKNSKKVALKTGSTTPGPLTENRTGFTIVFRVSIDGLPYSAKVSYAISPVITLSLTNAGGEIVYDKTIDPSASGID
jgi:hypothetical protein